jgi:hypothetical protein
MNSDSFVDFSFVEDGEEMFAIGCTVNYKNTKQATLAQDLGLQKARQLGEVIA